jgi:putative aldouronate transport system permease protein
MALSEQLERRLKEQKRGLFFRQLDLQSMILPGVIAMIIFNFLPLYGLTIAFKNYRVTMGVEGFWTAPWVGLEHFKDFFTSQYFGRVVGNTLGINVLGLAIRFPLTIIFALFLNEVYNRGFQRFVQTISYLPHFISWVIFGGIIMNLLSIEGGVVNNFLMWLGVTREPIFFMGEPKFFWFLAVFTGMLKEIGWNAILYLAAMAGIDPQLYEAAIVDGAGRFKRMWYITLPSIAGTVVILLIFAISGIFNSSFDQIWVLQNSLNVSRSEVIVTYVYKVGLTQMRFSYATAVGLLQSVLAVLMLVGANFISKRITDRGLF